MTVLRGVGEWRVEARMIDLKEVERITSLKKSAIYEAMKVGTFPPNYAIHGTRKAWRSDEIQEWVHGRRVWGRQVVEAPARAEPKSGQIALQHHKAILAQWAALMRPLVAGQL